MKRINTILGVFLLVLLVTIIYFSSKQENFNNNQSLGEIEKKIKLLEFAMTGMKDNNNKNNNIKMENKPYKTVYNYY